MRRRRLIRPQSLTRFLNQSRSLPRLPVLEPDAQEQEIRRLKAQRTEWANMATVARLDRDRLQSELESAKQHSEWLGVQNKRLWELVGCVEGLLQSRTWGASSLAESDAGPVNRVRHALAVLRRVRVENGQVEPLGTVYRIDDPGLK